MELIYSTQSSGFDPDKRYRNPEHFDRPEAGVTGVVVVGEWSKVVEAYEHVGVEVTLKEAVSQLIADYSVQSTLDEENGNLRAERDGFRGLIESLESAAPLEHPGAGELPIRLFYALSGIHAGMTELATARDELAAENERLRNELAELRAGEGKEVEALKAVLDVAGVSYRANASKESLEKLVADLPKA